MTYQNGNEMDMLDVLICGLAQLGGIALAIVIFFVYTKVWK